MNRMARNAKEVKNDRPDALEMAKERRRRGQWYWLSFATRRGFLGGAIVWAHGIDTAVLRARALNISKNFRGQVEVFCEPVPARVMQGHIPADLRNRLLSADEIRERLQGLPIG
jgi:hypothetical protein